MAKIGDLRDRSEELFTRLLAAQVQPAARGRRAVGVAGRPRALTFSWFNPDDAVAAATLSFRLAALAASRARVNDALEKALGHVEQEIAQAPPEQVRQGFALFVTHNRDGRLLSKPRTVAAAPALFRPPAARRGQTRAVSIGGASPGLDYWREDALANEHHQHWHEVYPFTGLPPRDFRAWVADTPRADMVAILDVVAPGTDWQARVSGATATQLAQLFARVVRADEVMRLPPVLFRRLFRLNDRQGELFFYMHQQMLARYDAELVSNGLGRVTPFGPQLWTRPIPEGHDPIGLPPFGRRDVNGVLDEADVEALRTMDREIRDALAVRALRGPDGAAVAIDRTNFGEAVEAAIPHLRDLDGRSYPGLHNNGHGAIAALSARQLGVMASTVTAIRDQIFWRWHKYVDDFNAAWQDTQPRNHFGDAPDVLIRNGLGPRATTAWRSPDIILCFTTDLPDGTDPVAIGQQLFGGENWDRDFSAAEATAGGTRVRTRNELTTTMRTVRFGGQNIRFLTHEPFSYYLRLENRSSRDRDVTVRIFLAPGAHARDRRAWIEMDKFLVTVPAATRFVVHRADTEASVVKRPVDTNPTRALGDGGGPDEDTYCDCGWPYTLLLPRGTATGLDFRLMALCTDAAVDQVPMQDHCGSMSFCGAVDRYPDTRDMGYPFARPFGTPAATAIRDAIVNLPSAAARTVRIRHTG